jgi:hypothetical protein
LGYSQDASTHPNQFPPQNATVVAISKDKVYELQTISPPLPEKAKKDYACNVDLAERQVTVKTTAGVVSYQLAIPDILKIAPELHQADISDGFEGARVTQTGKLIVRYFVNTDFYYSDTEKKFVLMPEYVREGEDVYSTSGWIEFSKDLFYSHLSTRYSEGDGIAIYDAETKSVYRLRLPLELMFESDYASLDEYDSVNSIVEVKSIKRDEEYGRDLDSEVTGKHGYYRIELAP